MLERVSNFIIISRFSEQRQSTCINGLSTSCLSTYWKEKNLWGEGKRERKNGRREGGRKRQGMGKVGEREWIRKRRRSGAGEEEEMTTWRSWWSPYVIVFMSELEFNWVLVIKIKFNHVIIVLENINIRNFVGVCSTALYLPLYFLKRSGWQFWRIKVEQMPE